MTINYTPTTGLAGLGAYSVSITDTIGAPYADGTGNYAPQTRTFPADTSFEPYRREAFRHRSIPGQREAIQMTNIMGEGTVNTEGLWRREQRDWNDGAGQQYLDHRQEDSAARFYSSKGVDVFNYPYQATLLPDTYRAVNNTATNIMTASCNGYMVTGSSTKWSISAITSNSTTWTFTIFNNGTAPVVGQLINITGCTPTAYNGTWTVATSSTTQFTVTQSGNPGTASLVGYASMTTIKTFSGISTIGAAWYGNTTGDGGVASYAPGTLYGMAAANSYLYIATDTGIWYCQPNLSSTWSNFTTGSYNMVAWANDQLIAASGPNLYAFQPRSSTTAPIYGSGPTTSVVTQSIASTSNIGSGFRVAVAEATANFIVGQSVTINNTQTQVTIGSLSISGNTLTATSFGSKPHGLNVGNSINVSFVIGTTHYTETVTISSINAGSYQFSWITTTGISSTSGFSSGTALASTSLYNGTYTVEYVGQGGANTLTLQLAGGTTPDPSVYGSYTIGGSIGNGTTPDLLMTHQDPNWVWSSAVGGETQIYFAGYSNRNNSKGNGCIYRSDLLGASTTSPSGTATVSTATVAQPFQLVSPVQALPMSPDEYPVCVQSYLNFIFIGTNRGIRMAQTLSVYDPTATATGDLKSGPLIPNILQPLNNPVTAIIGDGRFVWFTWNNYDSSSTGLGKMDLTTFINGDPLAPVYASDLMVTGQGTINSLAWNPVTNLPVIAVSGLGVYTPYATNTNGRITATQYVPTGNITTSIFDYGIPDQKAPVYFEYGGVTPDSSTLQANVICEPLEPAIAKTLTTINPVFPYNQVAFSSPTVIGTAIKEYSLGVAGTGVQSPKSSQFQVVINLNAGTSGLTTPTLYRWTLKSFPNVVSGTNISVVLQLFSVDVVDGVEVYMDPYDNFYWLESLRQSQNLVTYQEGPLSASIAIIESLDWIPHKRRDNYENGYEGDCVVTIKTLGPYSYNKPNTN